MITYSFIHGGVNKWKPFPRYWLFTRGIRRSQVDSLHKVLWRGALMFSLICAWTVEQTTETSVIWSAIALIMTQLYWPITPMEFIHQYDMSNNIKPHTLVCACMNWVRVCARVYRLSLLCYMLSFIIAFCDKCCQHSLYSTTCEDERQHHLAIMHYDIVSNIYFPIKRYYSLLWGNPQVHRTTWHVVLHRKSEVTYVR